MKRCFTICFLLIFALLFIPSCQRREGTQREGFAYLNGNDETHLFTGREQPGFVLRVNAAFNTIADDTGNETDIAAWADGMILGERITVGEIRRATWRNDGAVYNFVEVRREDGRSGLAWPTHIASGGRLAVVVDDRANMFSMPQAANVTGHTLPRRTIVAIFPETESGVFVQARGFDGTTMRQNYIRLSSVSTRNSDIQSSILWQTAEPLAETGAAGIRRAALFEAALLDYPDSVFHAEINAVVNPNIAFEIETEPAYHTNGVVNGWWLLDDDSP